MIHAVLDTSAIRDQIHFRGDKLDFEKASKAVVRGVLRVSLADSAFCELVIDLLERRVHWYEWMPARRQFQRILDRKLPVLPGGRELYEMTGAGGQPVLPEATIAFQRRAWKLLGTSENVAKFERALRARKKSGRESRDAMFARVLQVADSARANWIGALAKIRERLAVAAGPLPKQEELAGYILLDLAEPQHGIVTSAALEPMARALGRFAVMSAQGRTPYNPESSKRRGDVFDFSMLLALALPDTRIITRDDKLRAHLELAGFHEKDRLLSVSELNGLL